MRALIWLAFLLLLLSGYGIPRSEPQTSPPPQGDGWVELAPGIHYKMMEQGRVSLDYNPPLFTAEGVAKFEKFAQEQMSKALKDQEKKYWEEEVVWAKRQHALWASEEMAVMVLEFATLSRFPLPLSDADRQALRAKLREIVRLMKQGTDPKSLPKPDLPPQLRTPDGGMVVGPDTFPILVQNLTPQSLFPSCSLAASAMPTTASPGAKAYAFAECGDAAIWGSTGAHTFAAAGNNTDSCHDSGWPASGCISVAYGNTGCRSSAYAEYFYSFSYLRLVSRRLASNSRCQ